MLQIEKINEKIKKKYSVEKAWRRFESRLERGNKLTSNMYKKWSRRFLDWALERNKNLEDSQTLFDWDDYLYEKRKRKWLVEQKRGRQLGIRQKYSYSSRIIALTAGKSFMSIALNIDTGDIREVNKIAKEAEDEEEEELSEDKILSESEIETVIGECEKCINPTCGVIARLGFNLVLRAADLVKIKPENLNLEEEKIYVNPAKGSVSRTHRLIDMPFMSKEDLISDLSELERNKYLFKNNCQDRPTASASIRTHFVSKHNQSFHEFARHSAICWFIENYGFDRAYLRARHTNYSMTTRYARFTEVEPSEEIE